MNPVPADVVSALATHSPWIVVPLILVFAAVHVRSKRCEAEFDFLRWVLENDKRARRYRDMMDGRR